MPFCPQCRSEYRESFSRCANCERELVAFLPREDAEAFARLEKLLEDGQAALSLPRPLEDAQRDQELLHEAQIPCLLYGNPNSVGPQGVPTLYHLALLPEQVDLAAAALGRRHREMLAAEGLTATDSLVDLSQDQIRCPACGCQFPKAEECPDCGLFLGAPA